MPDGILSVADINATIDQEPRIIDLRLAEALGFERPRDIRKIIERNRATLARFGEVCATVAQTVTGGGGRPGRAYWLNKRQALFICTKSETPRATEVTIAMVDVFDAYMAGRLVAAPAIDPSPAIDWDETGRAVSLALACLRIHGRSAAQRLWRVLKLPDTTPECAADPADGTACLAHLRSVIADAAAAQGVARGRRQWAGYVLVANTGRWLDRIFAGTPWAGGLWRNALIGLPGALRAPPHKFNGHAARATAVPAHLMEVAHG